MACLDILSGALTGRPWQPSSHNAVTSSSHKNTTTETQQRAWQLPMVRVKEEFHTADKLFTTVSRFYSKIIAFLLAMDGNMVTKDFPNIILERRGKYCAAFDCNYSHYGLDSHCTSYPFFTFPKNVQQRNRWWDLIKRQHGKNGFLRKLDCCLYGAFYSRGHC